MASVSDVGICNSALIKLGADTITAFTDGTKASILCNEQYPKLRDEVLTSHPWNFAIKRVQLAQLATAPLYGPAFRYRLPTDCLKVLTLDGREAIYEVEGRELLTDESTVKMRYIFQETDTGNYSPPFTEALATRIAVDLAYSIVQSRALANQMYTAYLDLLRKARSFDAQEGTPRKFLIDDFTDSRRTNRGFTNSEF